jgi:hypothetical protein
MKHNIEQHCSFLLQPLPAPSVAFWLTPSRRWMELRDLLVGHGVSEPDLPSADLVVFILEGIATVVVAIIAFFLLHDFPETASFLTEEERAFVIHRLRYDGTDVAMDEGFRWKYVRQAFLDWQIYLSLFIYWGTVV